MESLGISNLKIVLKGIIEISQSQSEIWEDGKVNWRETIPMLQDTYKSVKVSQFFEAAWQEIKDLDDSERDKLIEFVGALSHNDNGVQTFETVLEMIEQLINLNSLKQKLASLLGADPNITQNFI